MITHKEHTISPLYMSDFKFNQVVKRGGKTIYDPRKATNKERLSCTEWIAKQDRNTRAVARIEYV